jgi:hypothetical protein
MLSSDAPPSRIEFSDYVVFVDETGDHGIATINPEFPLFGLAFCVLKKSDYTDTVTPEMRRLKFATFGHDMVILHEHDIRKKGNAFAQMNRELRDIFLSALTDVIQAAPFVLITVIIDKRRLAKGTSPSNPYHLALLFGLERLFHLLSSLNQDKSMTHVVVESRGRREDMELEVEFRRICSGENASKRCFPFQIIMADKRTNSEGLQLADMVARPVALSVLRPDQPNRAWEILRPKVWRGAHGDKEDYGLKVFPEKNERPPGSPSDLSPNG